MLHRHVVLRAALAALSVQLAACNCGKPLPTEDGGMEEPPELGLLQVSPRSVYLRKVGQTAALQVNGIYTNAPLREVTAEAGFSSRDEAVATVAPDGVVTARGSGATTVEVRVGETVREVEVKVALDATPPSYLELFNATRRTGLREPAWWGRTEPAAQVELRNGTVTTRATADADGIFVLKVPLQPNQDNVLMLALTDRWGNRSAEQRFDVEQADGLRATQRLGLVSGNNQLAFSGGKVPQPLTVIVTGEEGAPIIGREVTFRVIRGEGSFDGPDSVTVLTDAQGRASATPTLGARPGRGVHVVMAMLKDDWAAPVSFSLDAALPGNGETKLTGVVLSEQTTAIPGATVFLKDPRGVLQSVVTTDESGRFEMASVPAGRGSLLVDGRTSTLPNKYAEILYDVNVLEGISNTISAPIILPKLPDGVAVPLDAQGRATQTVEISVPVKDGQPPMIVTVPQGTKVTFPPGLPAAERKLRIFSVPAFGIPMPFPNGLSTGNVMAVQPANTLFDPPLPLKLPNVDNIRSGERVPLISYDHAAKQYREVGYAVVNANGTYLETEPGSGIIKGAWHLAPPKEPDNTTPCGNMSQTVQSAGECVCMAPGQTNVACQPGKPVCVPNAPAQVDEIAIRAWCDGKGSLDSDGDGIPDYLDDDDDGDGIPDDEEDDEMGGPDGGGGGEEKPKTLFIHSPGPGTSIAVGSTIQVVAKIDNGTPTDLAQISWEVETATGVLWTGAKTGPVTAVKAVKELLQGFRVTARWQDQQASTQVVVLGSCVSVGLARVCGSGVEPLSDTRFEVKGPTVMGPEAGMGISGGPAIADTAAGTISTSGAQVNTTWGPFLMGPITLNGSLAISGVGSVISAVSILGFELKLKGLEAIENGVEGNAEFKLPPAFGEGELKVEAKLKKGETPVLSGETHIDAHLPKLGWGVKLEIELKTEAVKFFGEMGPEKLKLGVGGGWNWKTHVISVSAGMSGHIQLGTSPFALKKLRAGFSMPWGGYEGSFTVEAQLTVAAFSALKHSLLTIDAEGSVTWGKEGLESYKVKADLSLIAGKFNAAKASVDFDAESGEMVIKTRIQTPDMGSGHPATKSIQGSFDLFLRITADGRFYGSANGSVRAIGKEWPVVGANVSGSVAPPGFIAFSIFVGPVGLLPQVSINIRVDEAGGSVTFCADYALYASTPWAGVPVELTMPAGLPEAIILVRREPGLPKEFQLTLPDGTVVTSAGTSTVSYLANPHDGSALFAIKNPAPGIYRVHDLVDPDLARSVELRIANAAPTLWLAVPQPMGSGWRLEATAGDPDDRANVSFFYDSDDEGFDGTPIVANLPESDGLLSYSWVPNGVTSGRYWVYGVVQDGNDHFTRAYAPAPIELVEPGSPAPPPTLRDSTVGAQRWLEWPAVPGAGGYLVELRRVGRATRTFSESATRTLLELEAGASYLATVRSVDATGKVGAASDFLALEPRVAGANVPQLVSRPPSFAKVGRPWQHALTVVDADTSETIGYRVVTGPPGAAVSPSGVLSWTPSAGQEGLRRIDLRIADSSGKSTLHELSLMVFPAANPADIPPQVVSPAPLAAQPGQPFRYAPQAYDADGDPLTWSLALAPTGMTIAPATGAISWTPAAAQLQGGAHVALAVSDGRGGTAYQRFTLSSADTDGDGLRDTYERVNGLDPSRTDTDRDGTPDGQEDADGDGLGAADEQAFGSLLAVADSDGDGLSDAVERTAGGDPLRADTDGDGLSDADEQMRGTSLSSADTDNDGVTDARELQLGTDPKAPGGDADGDGLSDDRERAAGTDPAKADTDGDGLSDADELQRGLDPTAADTDADGVDDAADARPTDARDTDHDGLSDDLERRLGFDPSASDTDGDGWSDGVEHVAGTDVKVKDNPDPPPAPRPITGVSKSEPPVVGGLVSVGLIPLGNDADLDGIPDHIEVRYGLDPTNPRDALLDADGDGLSNVAEYRLGTNLTLADTDGDGVDDQEEVQVGTDPLDPASNRNGVQLTGLTIQPSALRVIFNVIDGAQPQPLKVFGVLSDRSLVPMAEASRGTTYSTSNPAIGTVSSEGWVVPGGMSGNFVATARNSGFSATASVDVDRVAPGPLAILPLPYEPMRVQVRGDRVYTAGPSGFCVVDVSLPAGPRIDDCEGSPVTVNDVAVGSGRVALGTADGVAFWDVRDPTQAQAAGQLPITGGVQALIFHRTELLAVSGQTLYVIDASATPTATGLLDVNGDGADDRVLARLTLPGAAARIDALEGTAAVALSDGFTLIDVKNARVPAVLATRRPGKPVPDLQLSPTLLYLTENGGDPQNGALSTWSLSNPRQPSVVSSSTEMMIPTALTLAGQYAFVPDFFRRNATLIFRIGDPLATPLGGTIDFSMYDDFDAKDLAADSSLVFTVDGSTLKVGRYRRMGDSGAVPPTAAITEPSTGARFFEGQPLAVKIAATDDVQVAVVELYVDGVLAGAAVAEPYEIFQVLPEVVGRTPVKLEALVTDLAGNSTRSAPVLIDVDDDLAPPQLVITSPSTGASVSRQVPIAAEASDNVSVRSVAFTVNGAPLLTDLRAPYRANWDTCSRPDGTYALGATATDAWSNTASRTVQVTLDNASVPPGISVQPGTAGLQVTAATCGPIQGINVYWSTSPGVTTASTRIAGVMSPYALVAAPGSTVYVRVAAVRGGVEGPLSREVVGRVGGVAGICSRDDICFSLPAPFSGTVSSAEVLSRNDMFLNVSGVGVLRFDGTSWANTTQLPGFSTLYASGPNDVWGIGSGRVGRYDGTGWGLMSQFDPTKDYTWALSGSGANDVWIGGGVSNAGSTTTMTWHWDGMALTPNAIGVGNALDTILAIGPNDVWATLRDRFFHWDGMTWTSTLLGTGQSFERLAASGPNDVWAVGLGGAAHFDGTAWARVVVVNPLRSGEPWLNDVLVLAPNDVWVAGPPPGPWHWDGASFTARPTPVQDEWVYDLSVAPTGEVYAMGESGSIFDWNGTAWRDHRKLFSSGTWTTGHLTDVAALADDQAWAVDDQGRVLAWNGADWSVAYLSAGTVWNSVYAAAPDDVWVAGTGGKVLRFNGLSWSAVPTGVSANLNGIHGSAASGSVWAVGQAGVVLRWDGAMFVFEMSGSLSTLNAVAVVSATNVWIAGAGGTVLRYDGVGFTALSRPLAFNYADVSAGSANDVWLVGEEVAHWDGTTLTGLQVPGRQNGYFGSQTATDVWVTPGGGDAWLVTTVGMVMKWDGVHWSALETPAKRASLRGVAGDTGGRMWLVGDMGNFPVVLRSGLGPLPPAKWVEEDSPTTGDLASIAGTGATNVWAGGSGGFLHYDGTGWTQPMTTATSYYWWKLYVAPTGELFAASQSGSGRGSGTSFTVDRLSTAWAIGGTSASDVWLCESGTGGSNNLLHWDGTAWTVRSTLMGYNTIRSFFALAPNDVWAVGSETNIGHWDGTSWTFQSYGGQRVFETIWGTSSSNLWAGGRGGLLMHYDGTSWSHATKPWFGDVTSIFGSSATEVYAVTSLYEVARWDGTRWTVMPYRGGAGPVAGVSFGPNAAWIVGNRGTISRYVP